MTDIISALFGRTYFLYVLKYLVIDCFKEPDSIQIIYLTCCKTFAKLHHLLLSELDIEYVYE